MDPISESWTSSRKWASLPVLDYSLEKLNLHQRIIFLVIVIVLISVAIIGNLLTIFYNIKRQIRPLFKMCLISLAMSDLVTAVFTSVPYISQFITRYTVLWILGEFMCNWVPYLTTMAILVNSITLVGIALDRYMAVVKVLRGSWEPSFLISIIGVLFIWAICAGISIPMMAAYFIVNVEVIETDPNNRTIGYRRFHAQTCVNDKYENTSYFGIVFATVFLPLFLAFVWLNATIAIEIWNRRNPLDYYSNGKGMGLGLSASDSSQSSGNNSKGKDVSSGTKTTSNLSSSSVKSNKSNSGNGKVALPNNDNQQVPVDNGRMIAENQSQQPPVTEQKPRKSVYQLPSNNCRKTRQLRMFKVIIVIMTTFFVCRLPTWIFLLIKLNRDLGLPSHWVLHFSFGILSLTNCAINPFLYTFLSETIRAGTHVRDALKRKFGCCFTEESQFYDKFNTKSSICYGFMMSCLTLGFRSSGQGNIDQNLIDYGECDERFFKRKSYTIATDDKQEINNISSKIIPSHYIDLYANEINSDNFVDIDLGQK